MNVKEIYYQYNDEIEAPASDETVDVPIVATPAAPVIATTTAVSIPSFGPVTSMEDIPIKAIDILLVIVAQKLKKRVDETPVYPKPFPSQQRPCHSLGIGLHGRSFKCIGNN